MKTLLTGMTLAATLISASALADSNNVQQGLLADGIHFETSSHYASLEQVTIDRANLPTGNQDATLYQGSR